jgi:hypothetical protein
MSTKPTEVLFTPYTLGDAERIRRDAPLNEPRPEYFYGSSATGYTDYPVLSQKGQTRMMPW